MARQFNINTIGEENIPTSFIGGGAWHRLGNAIPEQHQKDFDYLMREGGLDFEVKKLKFSHPEAAMFEEKGLMVPEFEAYGTFRADTGGFLGSVGTDYTVIQNPDGFRFLEDIISEGYSVDSAGVLRGGAVVFANVKIMESEVVSGDTHAFYAQFTNSHDGTQSLSFLGTSVRIVCGNTLRMAINNGKKTGKIFKISHTKNAAVRLQNAKEFLSLVGASAASFGDKLKMLASKKLTTEMEKIFLDKLIGEVSEDENANKRRANMREAILSAPDNSDVIRGINGTAYSMLQRVTNYYTHGTAESKKDPMSLAVSSEFGAYAKKKEEAFNLLLSLAN